MSDADELGNSPGEPRPRPGSYEVGYGRPPKHAQFKPGQPSANPKGRPRGSGRRQDPLLKILAEKMAVTWDGKRRRMTIEEVLNRKLVKKALEGDARAMDIIMRTGELLRRIYLDSQPTTEELRQSEEKKQEAKEMTESLIATLNRLTADRSSAIPGGPKQTELPG